MDYLGIYPERVSRTVDSGTGTGYPGDSRRRPRRQRTSVSVVGTRPEVTAVRSTKSSAERRQLHSRGIPRILNRSVKVNLTPPAGERYVGWRSAANQNTLGTAVLSSQQTG